MKRFAVLAALAVSVFATPANAQELPISEQGVTAEVNSEYNMRPTYEFGFKNLSELVDMGIPLEPEHTDEDGHVVQLTSNGLAYYLPEQNQVAFTDGFNRVALTDNGLTTWSGDNLVAPEPAPVPQAPVPSDPRSYLYAIAPDIAKRMDCIGNRESGWNPNAKNSRSTASGLFQFLNTTWAATPQGRAGYSVFDPIKNVEAAVWLYRTYGATQWEVVTKGLC